ncbi:MAG: alpha/beta fold hydrolase [Vicinamibacterales bacterium]
MRVRHSCAVVLVILAVAWSSLSPAASQTPDSGFTLKQVLGYPFPSDLVASPTGQQVAWVFTERGVRNVWVAEGPRFEPRRLTSNTADDGQELTGLAFSPDGRYLVWVRGGDHGTNWSNAWEPNPASTATAVQREVWSVSLAGGAPKKLANGDDIVVAPSGDRVVFVQNGQFHTVPIDGSAAAARWFFARGRCSSPSWSPDGKTLAFVLDRDDHSFIALYSGDDQPLRYIAPSTSRDSYPVWSPDGRRIAFVRQPGRGGPAQPLLAQQPSPWAIWIADVSAGRGREVWRSPDTLAGSYPRTEGGPNLYWADRGYLVFLAGSDGWPHLYSLPADGGDALLLTPGNFMVEFVTLTPDRRHIVYNANTGPSPDDIERRHVFMVPVDMAKPVQLTSGIGIESAPVVTGDGGMVAYIGAGPQQPPLPMVQPIPEGQVRTLGADRVPADFPTSSLAVPEHVMVKSADGTSIHCQLFRPRQGAAAGKRTRAGRGPAIVFVHGGPSRQMLLGWHYRGYYANTYAVNQYLANLGYLVLSVNYRLGIGYGEAFQRAEKAGTRGASEYEDIVAAARYLRSRDDVDAARIGIWGGSYGGYLTALALARNSDLFAAGVDIHGVHDRTSPASAELQASAALGDGITQADVDEALLVAWKSSPVSSISTWKSPVLLIHGDDDRNVQFQQTVDLVVRLEAAGVPFEEMVIPDETHHFLLYRNQETADAAVADFFERVLGRSGAPREKR